MGAVSDISRSSQQKLSVPYNLSTASAAVIAEP